MALHVDDMRAHHTLGELRVTTANRFKDGAVVADDALSHLFGSIG
jgi:hypothetical protein